MQRTIVEVQVTGISALIMHKFPLVPIEGLDKMEPAEQAEHAAYRDPETLGLYVPGVNVQRALIAGAAYSKGKGRATLQKPASACLMIAPERIALGVDTYELDARPVVIPATKGRIMRFRPRLDAWQLTFEMEYDPTLISAEQARQIVDDTGSRVGLLDFRPEKKGPFGRFVVTSWQS